MVVATLLLSAPFLRADDAKVVPTARAAAVLPEPSSLSILPAAFTIQGADNKQQMLVTGSAPGVGEERSFDFSHKVAYTSSDAKVASVSENGVVTPRGNGKAEIRASYHDKTAKAEVTVRTST